MAGDEKEKFKEMMAELDYNELSDDIKFVKINKEFDEYIAKIEQQINTALKLREDSHLSWNDAIKLDNYLAFAMNSLFWMYQKIQGADHKLPLVNAELARARQTILRDNAIEENSAAPRLDVPAARRFIGHGTHTRFDETEEASPKVFKVENLEGKALSLQEKLIEQRKQALAQLPKSSSP